MTPSNHSRQTSSSVTFAPSTPLAGAVAGAVADADAGANMDFPIIRRAVKKDEQGHFVNGTSTPTSNGIEDRIAHTPDKDLPGGANWVVQKFGGTSVGKFAVKIAEDIVVYVADKIFLFPSLNDSTASECCMRYVMLRMHDLVRASRTTASPSSAPHAARIPKTRARRPASSAPLEMSNIQKIRSRASSSIWWRRSE